MKTRCLALLALLPPLGAQHAPVAFERVNVVPMDREAVLADHTVVVHDGRIVGVGPAAKVAIPPGALHVDGRDRYLMPALADMHVHLTDPADLLLYLAHGVTTVRNMWGGPDTLALREKIRRGEVLGPRIFTTGPIMDGEDPRWRGSPVLTTVEAARAAVEEQKNAGYDAFKVYDRLAPGVFAAILARARELGLPVVGHVPKKVRVRAAIDAGQRSIEHLSGYYPLSGPEEIRELARRTALAGTWNCVTLVVHDLPYRALRNLDDAFAQPQVALVPPRVRARWDPATDARFGGVTRMTDELWRAHRARMETLYGIVAALHRAGAPLLLGTDAPNPFVVPGFSVGQELEQLVAAGLSPYEALRTGTVNPARFLGEERTAGTVALGNAADLLLLRDNPLDDVRHARAIEGVMLRGRWLSRDDLDARLAELIASYRSPDGWFAQMPDLPDGSRLQYGVFWNDTQIGADRFTVATAADGVETRHAQSVLKDQFEAKRISATRTAGGDRDVQRLEVTVWSGDRRGAVSATHDRKTLELRGTLPSGAAVDLREPIAVDAYLGTGILPHALAFAPRLMALPIGGELRVEVRTPEFDEVFEVSRTEVQVKRVDDTLAEVAGRHIRVRAFAVTLTTGRYSTPATLTIDEDGVPVTIDLAFQLGHKVFRRLE